MATATSPNRPGSTTLAERLQRSRRHRQWASSSASAQGGGASVSSMGSESHGGGENPSVTSEPAPQRTVPSAGMSSSASSLAQRRQRALQMTRNRNRAKPAGGTASDSPSNGSKDEHTPPPSAVSFKQKPAPVQNKMFQASPPPPSNAGHIRSTNTSGAVSRARSPSPSKQLLTRPESPCESQQYQQAMIEEDKDRFGAPQPTAGNPPKTFSSAKHSYVPPTKAWKMPASSAPAANAVTAQPPRHSTGSIHHTSSKPAAFSTKNARTPPVVAEEAGEENSANEKELHDKPTVPSSSSRVATLRASFGNAPPPPPPPRPAPSGTKSYNKTSRHSFPPSTSSVGSASASELDAVLDSSFNPPSNEKKPATFHPGRRSPSPSRQFLGDSSEALESSSRDRDLIYPRPTKTPPTKKKVVVPAWIKEKEQKSVEPEPQQLEQDNPNQQEDESFYKPKNLRDAWQKRVQENQEKQRNPEPAVPEEPEVPLSKHQFWEQKTQKKKWQPAGNSGKGGKPAKKSIKSRDSWIVGQSNSDERAEEHSVGTASEAEVSIADTAGSAYSSGMPGVASRWKASSGKEPVTRSWVPKNGPNHTSTSGGPKSTVSSSVTSSAAGSALLSYWQSRSQGQPIELPDELKSTLQQDASEMESIQSPPQDAMENEVIPPMEAEEQIREEPEEKPAVLPMAILPTKNTYAVKREQSPAAVEAKETFTQPRETVVEHPEKESYHEDQDGYFAEEKKSADNEDEQAYPLKSSVVPHVISGDEDDVDFHDQIAEDGNDAQESELEPIASMNSSEIYYDSPSKKKREPTLETTPEHVDHLPPAHPSLAIDTKIGFDGEDDESPTSISPTVEAATSHGRYRSALPAEEHVPEEFRATLQGSKPYNHPVDDRNTSTTSSTAKTPDRKSSSFRLTPSRKDNEMYRAVYFGDMSPSEAMKQVQRSSSNTPMDPTKIMKDIQDSSTDRMVEGDDPDDAQRYMYDGPMQYLPDDGNKFMDPDDLEIQSAADSEIEGLNHLQDDGSEVVFGKPQTYGDAGDPDVGGHSPSVKARGHALEEWNPRLNNSKTTPSPSAVETPASDAAVRPPKRRPDSTSSASKVLSYWGTNAKDTSDDFDDAAQEEWMDKDPEFLPMMVNDEDEPPTVDAGQGSVPPISPTWRLPPQDQPAKKSVPAKRPKAKSRDPFDPFGSDDIGHDKPASDPFFAQDEFFSADGFPPLADPTPEAFSPVNWDTPRNTGMTPRMGEAGFPSPTSPSGMPRPFNPHSYQQRAEI